MIAIYWSSPRTQMLPTQLFRPFKRISSSGKKASKQREEPSPSRSAHGVYFPIIAVATIGSLHNHTLAPQEVYIYDTVGHPTPMTHFHPQDGLEVVGVTQSLLGNPTPAIIAFQKKVDSWLEMLQSNFLPHALVWKTLLQVLWPLLWYHLAISTFIPQQANQLVSWLYQTLLPHLGVNQHIPMALHYAVPNQCLGLSNPFWEQGISAFCLFLEQANAHSTELVLLHASLELLYLELGTSSNLFTLPYM